MINNFYIVSHKERNLMQETAIKYFTPKEAQKTLPLVKQIIRDIINNSFQIRTIVESMGGDIYENDEVKKLAREIDGFIKELEEIGCFYKDWNFSIGLVDFPAIIDGKEVYLCWRSDEDEIKYYHDIDKGFVDRKPIPQNYLED